MPIRRRTTTTTRIDEFDNSVDSNSGTNLPAQMLDPGLSDVDRGTSIEYYEQEDKRAPETYLIGSSKSTTVGRTLADLIVVSKNDHRVMAVGLTAISILIFTSKFNIKLSIWENLKYGLITAAILNSIWFGTPALVKLLGRAKNNKLAD